MSIINSISNFKRYYNIIFTTEKTMNMSYKYTDKYHIRFRNALLEGSYIHKFTFSYITIIL